MPPLILALQTHLSFRHLCLGNRQWRWWCRRGTIALLQLQLRLLLIQSQIVSLIVIPLAIHSVLMSLWLATLLSILSVYIQSVLHIIHSLHILPQIIYERFVVVDQGCSQVGAGQVAQRTKHCSLVHGSELIDGAMQVVTCWNLRHQRGVVVIQTAAGRSVFYRTALQRDGNVGSGVVNKLMEIFQRRVVSLAGRR